MNIHSISIRNFRLLESVEMCLENGVTVIVGRNNSGKTSLTELFRRLFDEQSPKFRLEDFSKGVFEQFWNAFELHKRRSDETDVRQALPLISISLTIEYEKDEYFGPLADFIVDLDDNCTTAQVNIRYILAPGKIEQLFEGLEPDNRINFFKTLKERIPQLFEIVIEAQDPNDPTNCRKVETACLRVLLQFHFINAQRALDDASNKEKAVLGRIFERLFTAATTNAGNAGDQTVVTTLKTAVDKIQEKIDEDFNEQLRNLIPTFKLFGYPGLTDPQLCTETVLKVEQLLSNYTTVGYLGVNGVNLPESYNGLGPRNLIFILLKLFEFFKEFINRPTISAVHIIFIEEPEAHLHPQMQTVFIRKLEEIRDLFASQYNNGEEWPVQFVVTTHSSHIANEASFDSMRYFLTQPREPESVLLKTEVKDIRIGLSNEEPENREFLHKYMTLTRCDLLFADRAILIEGASERLLLPEMIHKFDSAPVENNPKLGNKYLSIMEVGGAYAHNFFNLLNFLNLRTLIITDIDTIDIESKKKCRVSEGDYSSNACVNTWFMTDGQNKPTKEELLHKIEEEKVTRNRRIAYQIPHKEKDACGRSFEDAFILANTDIFDITGSPDDREKKAWDLASDINKTSFAMKYAIDDTEWVTPLYIEEGLRWLATDEIASAEPRGSIVQVTGGQGDD